MRIHFIQHVLFEHPGYLLTWAKQQNHSVSTSYIYESMVLPALDDFDMLIIMGGPMGVYEGDKYDWLKKEKQFVAAAINAGKKVLGICLGCQVIANVLGVNVYPHTQKEIGWWPVHKVAENKTHPLLKNLPDTFTTFHWHGDTFDLPKEAMHLFYSDACAHQGFLYKNHVAGLQFHAEVQDDLLHDMTENDKAQLIPSAYVQPEDEINKLLPLHVDAQHEYLSSFIEAFIKL
jgi:GMP synthase-like glutamine amidotransferase